MADFRKGDILYGSLRDKKAAYHPLIYWDGDMENDFIGVMLTHADSDKFPDNLPILEEYFVTHDESGKAFDFQWNNTYFVAIQLRKPANWGPYTKNGEISMDGILYIESQLPNMEPVLWDDYAALRR